MADKAVLRSEACLQLLLIKKEKTLWTYRMQGSGGLPTPSQSAPVALVWGFMVRVLRADSLLPSSSLASLSAGSHWPRENPAFSLLCQFTLST